jgi:Mn2+/Fe2+ NRAMP family transporter
MGAAVEPKVQKRRTFRIRNFLSTLGPGLITGASDDDPSGIGTYSQAGAQLGFGVGWTMLLPYPLMAAIQEISGRIGRVTGHGIAGNVCRNFGAVYVWSLVGLLFAANTINIAADRGVIITTAATLHAQGKTDIESSAQMSATLERAGPAPGNVDAAAGQAIAACGGDAREAVKARLVTIDFLEAEADELRTKVSRGYAPGTAPRGARTQG